MCEEEDRSYRVIAFASEKMVLTFSRFPEIVAMDVTYKVNNVGLQLLTLMIRTNTFRSIPIFLALLHDDTKTTLNSALGFFKNFVGPSNYGRIEAFMLDKSATEREALKDSFGLTPQLLCKFHAFQANDRQIALPHYESQVSTIKGVTLKQHIKFSFRLIQSSKTPEEYARRVI